jgi:zinc transport system ATP-binding protein
VRGEVPDERELPAPLTLRLYQGPEVLFSSDRHWLHPLFDLEGFFARTGQDPAATRLVDRITGRAAAFLVVRLGIRELRTLLLSRRAVPVLEQYGVRFRCRELVDRVTCATEDLLLDLQDPEAAWALLRERRLKALRTAPPPLSAAGPGTGPPAAAGSGESPGRG